ncbi:MAG: hypothetical protein AMJ62_12075 [Myxococcales bacterium SG8_38]|nr:MAG: hypothetical protein AMJ62_12075 [Myxococcales bacterium SG8_38]
MRVVFDEGHFRDCRRDQAITTSKTEVIEDDYGIPGLKPDALEIQGSSQRAVRVPSKLNA